MYKIMATYNWVKIYYKWSYFNSLHKCIFHDGSHWLSIGAVWQSAEKPAAL